MVLLWGLLVACGSTTIVVSHEQVGCPDYDFENPPSETLSVVEEALALKVAHTGVIESCDADFEPDITAEGTVIEVREFWDAGGDTGGGEACQTCYDATVLIKDPSRGTYDFRWYLGDEANPWESSTYKVK